MATVRQAFRGIIGSVRSSCPVQLAQGSGVNGEQIQDAELFQHYGFTSNPLPGTMQILLPIGGRTSHSIVIATEHGSYRLQNLAPGEVALYTDEGSKIVLKRGRVIDVECDTFQLSCKTMTVNASSGASFTTPQLQTSQVLQAGGQIVGQGGMAVSGGSGASVNGNIQLSGSMQASGDVVASGKSVVGHAHMAPDGKTSPPL
ncbi:phage baseplate assembly protein V [Chromobacterium vaccinii]|uniref:phage baseplate assembly protein V n=1 Tax=Chromobacterium vaccinii TaxID=1108595 RepID=UPI003C79327F